MAYKLWPVRTSPPSLPLLAFFCFEVLWAGEDAICYLGSQLSYW